MTRCLDVGRTESSLTTSLPPPFFVPLLYLKPVRANPILTGHVYETKSGIFSNSKLWIKAGTYTPENHDFVRILAAPESTPDLNRMNATQMLAHVCDAFFPRLEPSTLVETQIKDKLPLFGTSLMILPNNQAVMSMHMSHAVGDGVTYFHLLKRLSLCMAGDDDGGEMPPLDWTHPLRATHELYPPTFSARDAFIAYGAPFFVGCLKNILTLQRQRKTQIILLEKRAVSQEKRRLRIQLNCTDISSNDVITAALCQANGSSDIFVFTESVRGKLVPMAAAGNFLWEIPVSREVCSHPEKLRKAVVQSKSGSFASDRLPPRPFLCGRVGRVTSLASVSEKLVCKDGNENVEILCTVPYLSFVSEIPVDVAVIFRFSNDFWGVLHNFAQYDIPENGILGQARQCCTM
jgi:hypothetical protein